MHSISKILTALLCILLAASPAGSGSMTLLGAGKAGAGGGGVTGWASLIPQSGLVNAWPYDSTYTTSGTATDPIGGKNSTQTGVTLNGSGPSANLNNAAIFNGTSSHGDTTLANVPTSAFSVVMWINEAVTTGAGRIMANDHTDADNKGIQWTVGPQHNFYVGNGTGIVNPNGGSLSASAWTMLTVTYDGTTVKTYTGTTTGNAVAFTGPVAAPTNNISFVFNPAYSGDFYNGMIAGVAIYNRALSPAEITTINGL